MNTWLQRADFDSTEEVLGSTEAIRRLSKHNWEQELAYMKELEASGKDFCPPGIGFVHDSGRILHICPGKELSMYHYHSSKKLFGLVPIGSSTVTIENYSNSQLPQLVLNFFDEQWEAIT